MNLKSKPILVKGHDRLASSVAVCLLNAGHPVTLYTSDSDAAGLVSVHLREQQQASPGLSSAAEITTITSFKENSGWPMAIIINAENLEEKKAAVKEMESVLASDAIIAINTESIGLAEIQDGSKHAERIIGLNWSEPAHTTFFLEIIANHKISKWVVDDVDSVARDYWKKDPYTVNHGYGIRARMMSAMVREAFYLLKNEYVAVEDIDRACRNDPGYYLPFAGHCRYMDLMGTFMYGMVMEDLNPELSKDTELPAFFTRLIDSGAEGMQNGKGFYSYEAGEADKRIREFRKFSYEIREIISKYSVDLHEVKSASFKKISSGV